MARKFRDFTEEVKKATGDLKDTCWKGYTAVGMKMKNGRKVPNCVPVKEEVITEDDLPKTSEKQKTVTVKHKTSGKELNVVDTPSVREKYKKMDYHPVKEEVEQIEEAEKIQKHRPGWMARMIKRDNPEMAAKMNQGKEMNKLMHKYGGKTSDEIAKMKKEETQQVSEQHREKGRFKPVKPHNVPETPGAMMTKESYNSSEPKMKPHKSPIGGMDPSKPKIKPSKPPVGTMGGEKYVNKHLEDRMKKEAVNVPFEGGKKAKGTVTDKSGAKHSPMSRVKDLARKAMQKQMPKTKVKESSNKAEIVKKAAKDSKEKFNPDPIVSNSIMKENK